MKKALVGILAVTFLFACNKDKNNDTSDYVGFVYTSTNSSAGNSIIAMGRTSDGSLTELDGSPFATGNTGDALEGDFDTQNGLRIVGDYLLAVNAGNNPINGSITVFKIDRSNGSLSQVDQNTSTPVIDNMDSRGIRATSIAAKKIGSTTWVVVGNQHSNPHYEKTPAEAVGTVTTSPLRNVVVFKFNQSNGLLEYSSIGATYNNGNNGGPTTVDFNTAGNKIAVSTWGVPHFLTADPNPQLQKAGRLYVYDFLDGNLNETGMYEEAGVSGNIGFAWSPNQQYIYLANFNLHSSRQDHSVTVHDANTAVKVQNFATGSTNDDEACWAHVTGDGKRLYIASFTGNIISTFDINADNKLSVSLNPNYFARNNVPSPDTKDIYEASSNLYVSGAFQSHSISIFSIGTDGKLTEKAGSPYHIPSSKGKTKEDQSFIGLAGFEK